MTTTPPPPLEPDVELITPDLADLPEADDAEPDDAGVEHVADPAEVDAHLDGGAA